MKTLKKEKQRNKTQYHANSSILQIAKFKTQNIFDNIYFSLVNGARKTVHNPARPLWYLPGNRNTYFLITLRLFYEEMLR